MGLLVEYSIEDGKSDAQTEALLKFVDGLKQIGDGGYNYTCFETDDPKRFIGLLEFDDEEANMLIQSNNAPPWSQGNFLIKEVIV